MPVNAGSLFGKYSPGCQTAMDDQVFRYLVNIALLSENEQYVSYGDPLERGEIALDRQRLCYFVTQSYNVRLIKVYLLRTNCNGNVQLNCTCSINVHFTQRENFHISWYSDRQLSSYGVRFTRK